MAHEPGRRRPFPAVAALACLALVASASEQSRLPGPLVYVVTPATRNIQIDSSPRRAPYYYNNWRRSDVPSSSTTTTTTTRPPPENHDLIFAEFESDGGRDEDAMRKSIRNLLQRERVKATAPTSTASTSDLIFAEFESGKDREKSIKNLLSKERINESTDSKIMPLPPFSNMYGGESGDDVHAAYNKIYEEVSEPTAPPEPTTEEVVEPTLAPMKVEDIWHVIDKEKVHEEEGGWQEVPLEQFTAPAPPYASTLDDNEAGPTEPATTEDSYNENFVFPGFHSNEDKATDNESRAIRTESNLRFPYVNLKTYQMKNKPLLTNGKKDNHMYTSVDHFRDVNHPLRGEAQDAGPPPPPRAQHVDRYNPAQPYLPPSPYGNANKQAASPAAPARPPTKTVANLIPPPPPPLPPQPSPGDFPSPPDTYESFPPYAPAPPPPKPPSKPALAFRPTLPPPQASDDSDVGSPTSDTDSGPPGYSYNPPGSGGGYSYKRPSSGGGYSYKPPSSGNGGYSYKPPPVPPLAPPPEDDTGPPSDDSAPPDDDKPSFNGYNYDKPHGPSLGHDEHDDSDYPEGIYSKPHGVQMMPPPPPPPPPAGADGGMGMDDAKPDFPNLMFPPHDGGGGYKHHHHHDFEDFEPYHHHHHHHTTTTTTTTTEMPRVNRFSYYYLGKKLYYLPLYFSVYFVVYVAALIIKAVLRHKIVYPNSWQPYSGAAGVSRRRGERSLPAQALSPERLHELTRLVTNALMRAAEKYTADHQQH